MTVTDPPGTGDDDPVAQFSDPELRHGYAEYPTQGFPSAPAGPPAPAGRSGHWAALPRWPFLTWLIIVLLIAAGLVAALAH